MDTELVSRIMRFLDDGYNDQQGTGYPPFAIAPWDDRARYRAYVEKRLLEFDTRVPTE